MKVINGIILFFVLSIGCKEPYTAPISSPPTGYLVVEGFINSGAGETSITLSRTTQLYDPASIVYENHAQVLVEGENGDNYPLYETTSGVYVTSQLHLNGNEKYRVHIITTDGNEYASDFSAVRTTPDIDSVSWQREGDGVHIYINTHDPQNNTRYYQWKYEETWEIHSAFLSALKFTTDPVTNRYNGIEFRNPNTQQVDTTLYFCWKNVNSTSITIGSSEKLSEDRIYLPFIFIENASEKLSVLYSVNLRQYALSHDAYLFYQKMKKNTEQLGSIFDPQPSDLQGNIHCLTDPKETVVGFVEVSQEKTKRIFISNKDVPDWGYRQPCGAIVIDNVPDSIAKYGIGVEPTVVKTYIGLQIKDFYAAESLCVDCTLRGTNKKPAFWP